MILAWNAGIVCVALLILANLVMSVIKDIEKTPLQSKKFLAYLIMNFLNKALLFYMIYSGVGVAVITWAITTSIFIDAGYILGVVALDLFVRLAQIKSSPPIIGPPTGNSNEETKP